MTMPVEEAERVRSYLLSQANRLSVPDLVDKVRTDTQPLRDAAAAVSPDRFQDRPGPDDWSAAEVIAHVLDMNEAGAAAIAGILDTGERPAPIADEMQHVVRRDVHNADDFWRLYAPRREQLYARVLQAKGDEHLDVKITHRDFGELSWREWLLFMRVHDLDHMHQLQALAQHFAG